MARPKKEIEKLRIYQFTIRLNQSEYKQARFNAGLINLSIGQWIRKSALSKNSLKQGMAKIDKETYKQLVKLGTNINQIAYKLNADKYTKIYSEIIEIKELLSKISNRLLK